MKRVLTFLALMLLPLSVMAMTPVSDSTLSDVTGQAGVNINANLKMDINIGTLAWGDSDGVTLVSSFPNYAAFSQGGTAATLQGATRQSNGGFVGVTGLNITNLVITARTGTGAGGVVDNYGSYSAYSENPLANRLKPITIDVGQDASGVTNGGKVFVRIGLGSLKITMDDLLLKVALGDWQSYGTAVTLDEQMGLVLLKGLGIYISPKSYVDIFAHGASGVTMSLNVIIDHLDLTTVAWGDSEGIAAASGTGDGIHNWLNSSNGAFVGLTGMKLDGITIVGQVAIDVAATGMESDIYLDHYRELVAFGMWDKGLLGAVPFNSAAMKALPAVTAMVPSVSIVRISFGGGVDNPYTAIDETNFNIGIATGFRATVSLFTQSQITADPSLATYKGTTLGDIYLSSFNVAIKQGSWVDIWAH